MQKVAFIYAIIIGLVSTGYAIDGFGQNTTGGAGGTTVAVDNGAAPEIAVCE